MFGHAAPAPDRRPQESQFRALPGIALATPNLHEAADAAGLEICDDASLRAAGARLLDRWAAQAVLVTRGGRA